MTTDQPPGLIATDLDGTFLSPDGTVSALNAEAVRRADQAGLPMVFATGRPTRWLGVVKDLPGAHPMVIASNGAAVYDLGTGEVVEQETIDPAVALDVVLRLRQAIPGVSFGFETGTEFGYEPTYRTWTDEEGEHAVFTGPAEDLVQRKEYVKVLVRHYTVLHDDLLDRVTDCLDGALTATHSAHVDTGLVELSALGVSKASTLQRYAGRLGLGAADVATFGDNPNDIAMLTWSGRPHVVANAHPRLLAMDFTVVGSNADSGVGRKILDWLP